MIVGKVEGDIVGWRDGVGVGFNVIVGWWDIEGETVGKLVGEREGKVVGWKVGIWVGEVGWTEGDKVGILVGNRVGINEGIFVGDIVGLVGDKEGILVGIILGCDVDTADGVKVIVEVACTVHSQVAQAAHTETLPVDGITIVVLVPTYLEPEQDPPVNVAPVLSNTIPFDGDVLLIVTDKVSPGVYCEPEVNVIVPLLTIRVLKDIIIVI